AVRGADDLVRYHLHLFVDFFVPTSHESLDRIDGIFGVGDGLALCDLSNKTFTTFCERHNRWGGAATFLVGNNDGLATLHNCNDGVGGAQIDSDNLAHL